MRFRYTRLALRVSVPSWVIARVLGQRQPTPFETAFGKVHGNNTISPDLSVAVASAA